MQSIKSVVLIVGPPMAHRRSITDVQFTRRQEMESVPSSTRRSLTPWIITSAVLVVLLLALVSDWAPWLRGYKETEWRWRLERGKNLPALVALVANSVLMVLAGWWYDCCSPGNAALLSGACRDGANTRREQPDCPEAGDSPSEKRQSSLRPQKGFGPQAGDWRSQGVRALAGAVIVILALAQPILATWVRNPNPGIILAERTTVYFLEDFFPAAQAIKKPSEAFTRYDYLRSTMNKLRIATHPPGLIAVYAEFVRWSRARTSHDGWLDVAADRLFRDDFFSKEYTPPDRTALLLATVFKHLFVLPTLAGLALMAWALGRAGRTGRLLALFCITPAATMFSVCLDSMILGLSTLAIGLFLASFRGPRTTWLAAAAGLVMAEHSLMGFQFVTTGWIAVVAGATLAWHRDGSAFVRPLLVRIVLLGAPILIAWGLIAATTGYLYPTEFFTGLRHHREGGIHAYRTRWAWLFWNVWDLLFFFGIAWVPLIVALVRKKRWALQPLVWALLTMWALMILGDGIRGETARLMLFAFAPAAAALVLHRKDDLGGREYVSLSALLILQTAVFAGALNLF